MEIQIDNSIKNADKSSHQDLSAGVETDSSGLLTGLFDTDGFGTLLGFQADSTEEEEQSKSPALEAQTPKDEDRPTLEIEDTQNLAMKQPSSDPSANVQDIQTVEAAQHLIESLKCRLDERDQIIDRLREKNKSLALKTAKVSEKDLLEATEAYQAQIKALTKERDSALRKTGDKTAEVSDLLKEKDEIIKQVMEEGEALSKKQLAQETTIKKLRLQLQKMKGEVADLTSRLENQRTESSAVAADREAVAETLAAARDRHAEELDAERNHYERLLEESKATIAAAEARAADGAKAGLSRRVRDAESRCEALEITIGELREELERQRAASDERDELLSTEVSELQRRCAEAEAKAQEAQARVPETTAPLLKQIEFIQKSASQQAASWSEAEKTLILRLKESENEMQQILAKSQDLQKTIENNQNAADESYRMMSEAQSKITKLESEIADLNSSKLSLVEELDAAKAELRTAKDTNAMLETVYGQQLEAAQIRESQSIAAYQALEHKYAAQHIQATEIEKSPRARPPNPPPEPEEEAPRTPIDATAPANIAIQQLTSLQRMVTELQITRDKLSEELIKAETEAAQGKTAQKRTTYLEKEVVDLKTRLATALELLGEKEERVEELTIDLAEVKAHYRHQIEFMANQMDLK